MRQPDAGSRRKKLLPAALLAASGALMMLASSGSGDSRHLRHPSASRKLSADKPPRKLVNAPPAGSGTGSSSNGEEGDLMVENVSVQNILPQVQQPQAEPARAADEAIAVAGVEPEAQGKASDGKIEGSKAEAAPSKDGTVKISPQIAATVHKLAAPLLADEANIFAFDANDPRPVMNTFFAIPETLAIKKDDAETLAVWKRAWSNAGWNPVSLEWTSISSPCAGKHYVCFGVFI